MFELWLLLHFGDGSGVASARICTEQLKKALPNYDKDIDSSKFPRDSIKQAVRRARQRDNPPCSDWLRDPGVTTVYRLVEKIVEV